MKIEELDANFALKSTLGLTDVSYYDVRQQPFELYGFFEPLTQPDFVRMDPAVAEQVSPGVTCLNYNTAGGRVRFSTDSQYVVLHCRMKESNVMPHMAATGSKGFDLYLDENGTSRFCGVFQPDVMEKEYERVVRFPDRRLRFLTLNFPLYNDVQLLAIGLQQDARLGAGACYRNMKPVLYYGSSITQGGCASRPGTCYQAAISRQLNCDYVNLGFSGNARGEDAMADYLARQECSVLVLDYDHNAPTVEHLRATHEKLYRTIRAAQPELPIILVSRPGAYERPEDWPVLFARREVVSQTFRNACAQGDQKVWYIDGESLFAGLPRGECTVDGCHPNDLGFYGMARIIGEAVARFLPPETH